MEILPTAESNMHVDHDFLDIVEAEIRRALNNVEELMQNSPEMIKEREETWKDAFDQMSAHLAKWEKKLGELTQETAAVEYDLNQQEAILRKWFGALDATHSRLKAASSRQ
jgi:hypothetical protein